MYISLYIFIFFYTYIYKRIRSIMYKCILSICDERWGAGVETQKNVRGEIGGWGRVPFNEPMSPTPHC